MTILAQITDLHLRPRGLTCYRVSDTNMLAERAVNTLRQMHPRPDAVIVTGDLTDRADEREYDLARHLLGRLSMPVFLIPGNHDTSQSMKTAFSDYPGMQSALEDKLCYTVEIGDIRLIGLDSSVPGKPFGILGKDQLAWLDTTLTASSVPTIVAVHHPPVPTGIHHMDQIALNDADELADVLKRHDHVERLICGHVHRPIISAFAGTIMTLAPSTAHQLVLDFDETAPADFNFEPPAFFLHRYTPASGLVTHMSYVESFPGPYPFWSDKGVTWPGD